MFFHWGGGGYLAELSDACICSFPCVLAIHCILTEEQIDLVVFGVVALRDQVHAHKPGVWE